MKSRTLLSLSAIFFALAVLFTLGPLVTAIFVPELGRVLWIVLLGGGWLIAGIAVHARAQAAQVIENTPDGKS